MYFVDKVIALTLLTLKKKNQRCLEILVEIGRCEACWGSIPVDAVTFL